MTADSVNPLSATFRVNADDILGAHAAALEQAERQACGYVVTEVRIHPTANEKEWDAEVVYGPASGGATSPSAGEGWQAVARWRAAEAKRLEDVRRGGGATKPSAKWVHIELDPVAGSVASAAKCYTFDDVTSAASLALVGSAREDAEDAKLASRLRDGHVVLCTLRYLSGVWVACFLVRDGDGVWPVVARARARGLGRPGAEAWSAAVSKELGYWFPVIMEGA